MSCEWKGACQSQGHDLYDDHCIVVHCTAVMHHVQLQPHKHCASQCTSVYIGSDGEGA